MRLLERCDAQTQSSFARLEGFLDGGSRQKEFEQLAGRLRHNLVFHYDESGKLIKKSLKRKIEKFPGSMALVTRGSTPIFWYFELADELLDSILVRQIWDIPDAANLREAADEAIMRVHEVLLAFVDFAGEVIWKLTEK